MPPRWASKCIEKCCREALPLLMWRMSSCHIYRSVPLRQVQAALNWILDTGLGCIWIIWLLQTFFHFQCRYMEKQVNRCRNKAIICMPVKACHCFISCSVRGLKWLWISKAASTACLSYYDIKYNNTGTWIQSIHLITKTLTSAAINQRIDVPAVFLCVLTDFSIDLLCCETNCA